MFRRLGKLCAEVLVPDIVDMRQELLPLSSTSLGGSESLNATSFALELAR